jgi:hypothetical protein
VLTETLTADEVEKVCIQCAKSIPIHAKKCTECDSFQDWRRHLQFSGLALSLLIALLSVTGLTTQKIIEAFQGHRTRIQTKFVSSLHGTLEAKPDSRNALVVNLLITNSGDRPRAITAVEVKMHNHSEQDPTQQAEKHQNGQDWDKNTFLFDPSKIIGRRIGNIAEAALTTTIEAKQCQRVGCPTTNIHASGD